MLEVVIEGGEFYDEINEEFIPIKPVTLRLEHSLVSISKWESKWKKPFLVERPPKTLEELRDYVRCMTLNQNVDPKVYYALDRNTMKAISEYIDSSQTATTFSNHAAGGHSREILTSEVIYWMMFSFNIPLDCQKWHFSRLLTLLRIFSIKNSPPKKMSKREILAQNKALNDARRAKLHTKG